jgi:hypothetical protein
MKALGCGSQLFQIPKPLDGCDRAIGTKAAKKTITNKMSRIYITLVLE